MLVNLFLPKSSRFTLLWNDAGGETTERERPAGIPRDLEPSVMPSLSSDSLPQPRVAFASRLQYAARHHE
jgi:hypothetical protein